MSDSFIQVDADGAGKKMDTSELAVGAHQVHRERVVISSPTDPDEHAEVTSTHPDDDSPGVHTREVRAALNKKTVTASSSGDNTIHTPAAGKKIRLHYFGYSAGASVTGVLTGIKFGANAVFDNQYLSAPGQPFGRNIQAGDGYLDGAADEALKVNLGAAQTVYVNIEVEEVN